MKREDKQRFTIVVNWQAPKKSILSCAQLAVNILHDLMTFDNSVFNKIAHSAKKMEEIDFSLSLELNSQLIASQFVDEHKSDLKK